MSITETKIGAAPLTRRTFLERFGVVGGSTLVMSAMRSWDSDGAGRSAAGALRPAERHARRRARRRRVRADRRLRAGQARIRRQHARGARSRRRRELDLRRGATHTEIGAGGETQVCNFDEGLYLNGGPWRLPHWHTGVLGYCKELGVPLEVFINEGEASYFYYEGDNIGPLANKRVRLREVKADMLGYTCELMAKAVESERARHAADRRGQGAVRHVPRHRGLPRLRGPRLQEDDRAGPGRPARLPRAAAVRIRQPDPVGHRGHGAGADVPAGRRHGPVPEGLPAKARRQASRSAPRSSRFARATPT